MSTGGRSLVASRSEQAIQEHEDVSESLMDSTIDEYLAICTAVAQSMGASIEEHEISRKVVVLTGKLEGKPCAVVSPLPSLRVPATTLGSVISSAGKGKTKLILLSVFGDDKTASRDRSIVTSKTGAEFLVAAKRTSAFRKLDYRLHRGQEGERPGSSRKIRDLMKYAREKYDAGDFGSSLKAVKSVESLEPLSDEAFRLEGNIHLKKGEFDLALLSFDSAIGLRPDEVDNLFGKASTLYMLGRYEDELNCYDQILKLKPKHRGALQNRGATLQHIGRLKEAVQAYEKLLRLKKNDVSVMKNLAIARYSLGNAEGALRMLDAILAVDNNEPRALRMKGLILAEQGRDEALDYLMRFSSSEKDENVLALIESLKQRLETKAAAEAVPMEVEEANPPATTEVQAIGQHDDSGMRPIEENAEAVAPPPVRSMAERLEKAGFLSGEKSLLGALRLLRSINTKEAAEAASDIWRRLKEAAKGQQASPEVSALMEEEAFELGEYEKAEKLAGTLLSGLPGSANKLRHAADLAFSGNIDDAISELSGNDTALGASVLSSLWLMSWKPGKAQRFTGKGEGPEPFTAVNRGMVLMEKRGPAYALDYFVASDQKNIAMMNNRAVCLLLGGDIKGSMELLHQCAAAGKWQYLFNLGACLLEAGKYAEGAESLRSSIAVHDSGIARNSLGVALAKMNDYEGAKREFEAALSSSTPYPVAGKNLKKLMKQRATA